MTCSHEAPARLTEEAYARAARLLSAAERGLVRNLDLRPTWIGEDRFWYRKETPNGAVFELVDAATLTRRPAFDHARLAVSLSVASGREVSGANLPFRSFTFGPDATTIGFTALGATWDCSLVDWSCVRKSRSPFAPDRLASPDGSLAAFRHDRNLWVESEDGATRALTTDGLAFNEYGWVSGDSQLYVSFENRPGDVPPSLSWSPDSKKLLVHRIDETAVDEMSLWEGAPPDGATRPRVISFKQSQPGDAKAPVTTYAVFDVASGRRIDVNNIPAGLVVDPIGGFAHAGPWLANWTADSAFVYVLAHDRHYRRVELLRIDAATGDAVAVVRETASTFVSLNGSCTGGLGVTVRMFDRDRQLLWFSERDGWGHLYRYELATGTLLNQVTSGPFVVTDIIAIDERNGVVFFLATGREKGRNPYLNGLYRVKLDGTDLRLLTPEDADHAVLATPSGSGISPGHRYVVDSYSRVDRMPASVLRSADTGAVLMKIEDADVSTLASEGGWTRPLPFTVKARDGRTDLFGTMYLPSNFDPAKKYPVIDHVYPGAHLIFPDVRALSQSYFYRQALAELGFIVVNMDGLGTPGRGKAFHDLSYGNLQDGPGLPDHVLGIRELARSHPQLDLDRVGILGHSSGGYGAVLAMLAFPDFYRVGVAGAAATNMCGAIPTVIEKWQGPPGPGGANWAPVVLEKRAHELRGRLLLAYGEMDEHVPPATTVRFIDALVRANRDYDLLLLPNRNHGFARDRYFTRRMMDYFVRNLMGSEPPPNASLADAGGAS